MASGNEKILNVTIDDRLESYTSFFDHEWVRSFLDLSHRSRLAEAGLVLARDWKSTANAARTPHLIVLFLDGFHEGMTRSNRPFHERLAKAFGQYVAERSELPDQQRQNIIDVVEKLGAEVEDEMQKHPPPFDPQEAWREMLQHSEFTMSLWSMQRMAYTGVYCAYENFVQRVVEVGRNDRSYRAMRLPDLKKDFALLLGQPLADECIDDAPVRTATLVRNCLSHDGGRESERLRAVRHGIDVVDGQLQILPEHVRALFNLLKGKATKIAEACARLPAFKGS